MLRRSKQTSSSSTSTLSHQQQRVSQRLQQRLNSLTFYDSIPLYDSQLRRGHVPRASLTGDIADDSMIVTVGANVMSANDAALTIRTSQRHLSSPVNEQMTHNLSDGPFWATIQPDTESDCDGVLGNGIIFVDGATPEAMLNGQSIPTVTAANSIAVLTPKFERQTPEGQAQALGACLSLQRSNSSSNIVYTHV